MSRTKEFERDDVLEEAIPVFAQYGYAGTSTATLLDAMGISRQSMYDTFGGKRSLYLAALRHHLQQLIAQRLRILQDDTAPLDRITSLLQQVVAHAETADDAALLSIGTVCEFGCSDREIGSVMDEAHNAVLYALESCIDDAKRDGQIGAHVETSDAACFISANMTAIELAARGGASSAILQSIAALAISTLTIGTLTTDTPVHS